MQKTSPDTVLLLSNGIYIQTTGTFPPRDALASGHLELLLDGL